MHTLLVKLTYIIAIEKLREGSSISTSSTSFVKLYIEQAEEGKPLPVLKPDQIILFIKYFDVDIQEMRYKSKRILA